MTKDQFLKAALGMEPSKVSEIVNADETFWTDVFASAIVVTVGLISIFSLLLAVLNLHSLWTLCGTIVLFFFGPFCSFRAALHRRGRCYASVCPACLRCTILNPVRLFAFVSNKKERPHTPHTRLVGMARCFWQGIGNVFHLCCFGSSCL